MGPKDFLSLEDGTEGLKSPLKMGPKDFFVLEDGTEGLLDP
jgi:hypothetical protein